MSASEGILYRTIRTSSAAAEKGIVSADGTCPTVPEKKSTKYRIRASICAPILLPRRFSDCGFYAIIHQNIRLGN